MKTLLSVLLLGLTIGLLGQDCNYYFNFNSGTTLSYELYNSKDKLDGKVEYKIIALEKKAGTVIATIQSTTYDKKDQELVQADFEFQCNDGELLVDIKSIVSPQTIEAYQDMDVKMEGDYMVYPKTLRVGDHLKDGELNIEVSSNGFPIVKMAIKTHDRVVDSKEKITVPAGTYETFKITSTTTTSTIFEIETSSAEWFAQDIGMVRSESYNKNGKLVSYMVLASIK